MTERRKGSRRRRPILWATLAAFAAGLVFTFAASTASLPGSDFEIDDGNLIVNNPAPAIDWASVNELRKADAPSGSTDDSFGQGTKEDTPVPTIVDGSIPPNKSDLLNIGVYLEENANGQFPQPVLAPRAGAAGHDEHGLRVQPVQHPVGQRRHTGANGWRRADPVRSLPGRHEPAAVPVSVGHVGCWFSVRGEQLDSMLGYEGQPHRSRRSRPGRSTPRRFLSRSQMGLPSTSMAMEPSIPSPLARSERPRSIWTL